MILPDVNILVYAFRPEHDKRSQYRAFLDLVVNGNQAYGMSELVLSGFVRIVTHSRIFQKPDPVEKALSFAAQLREQPHCVGVSPGPRHWSIFVDLCKVVQAKGNIVPDAYLAALAIEGGCEWVTTDRDYARFPGLKLRQI